MQRRSIPGTIFIGEKGKLMAEQYGRNLQLFPKELMEKYKQPQEGEPGVTHEHNWVQACKGGKPATSNFDYSGPFTEIVLLGNLAIRAGRKLYWDGPNMKVTNEPDANKYVTKEYRKGWEL